MTGDVQPPKVEVVSPGCGAQSPQASRLPLTRWWRHLTITEGSVRRALGEDGFARIEQAITESEASHRAEIRFAVEPDLSSAALMRGVKPRERALQVFAEHGIWDTAENTGILIYLLLADHAIEIVADRGVVRAVDAEQWAAACATIADHWRSGRLGDGVVDAIHKLGEALSRSLPHRSSSDGFPPDRDELPNKSLVL